MVTTSPAGDRTKAHAHRQDPRRNKLDGEDVHTCQASRWKTKGVTMEEMSIPPGEGEDVTILAGG
jgi:hypothetical protein